MRTPANHTRQARFLLSRFEAWFLPRVAARLPRWVLPDHLTVLALIAAVVITTGYALSNLDPRWLWLVNGALVVHWLGDSLDGTLARVRKTERPRYGFYLDHLADAFATVAVGLGLGFSPYMLLAVAMVVVVGYLVLSINVYLETHVFETFRYSYGVIGPTEVRGLLFGLNLLALTAGGLPFGVLGVGVTAFDVIAVAVTVGMTIMVLWRARRNLKALASLEPVRWSVRKPRVEVAPESP